MSKKEYDKSGQIDISNFYLIADEMGLNLSVFERAIDSGRIVGHGPNGNSEVYFEVGDLAKIYSQSLKRPAKEIEGELQSLYNQNGISVEEQTITKIPDYVGKGRLEQEVDKNSNQMYALQKKYLVRDETGEVAEEPEEAIYRMARTMAEVETQYGASPEEVDGFTKRFYHMISEGDFSPAGRIWTNAGTEIGGLFNCYVLPVEDDLAGIFESVKKAAIIHKNGGGTGYNFSKLRPRGTFVAKSQGIASGVVSFIEQFDKETEVINSGNRRGANMGIVNVDHPDFLDFIYAKTQKGKITNFNVSIGATDDFMGAVERGEHYDLAFPEGEAFHYTGLERIAVNVEENKVGGAEVGSEPEPVSLRLNAEKDTVIPGKTEVIDTHSGKVAGRVSENGTVQLYAPYVLETVAGLAWETGDPGMIFLDAINRVNPLPRKGDILATNPCGEQPLHSYDACNLGSIILANMVKETDDGGRTVDYDKLGRVVPIATRFMDNVNDANRGPIPEVEQTTLNHRRIGMGVMGWAEMAAELGLGYNTPEARKVAEEVMTFISKTAKEASVELAKEKGVFPEFEGSKYDDGNPKNRVRNAERTTIAPTGTIAMVYDVTGGIEPPFAVTWKKNIRGGDSLQYTLPSFAREIEKRGLDLETLIPLIEANHGSIQGIEGIPEEVQTMFKTSHDLSYEDHIAMQAAFQRGTDNAVSKTINLPNSATVNEVLAIYAQAWKSNLKGITVYRDGSKSIQVLETGGSSKDLEETVEIEKPDVVRTRGASATYDIETGEGRLHITVTGDERGYPQEVFENLGPIGTGKSTAASVDGLRMTRYLQDATEPDLLEILKDYGSAKGDSPIGFGPNRIDSLQHGLSIVMRYHLLSMGIVKQTKQGLEQVVFKQNEKKTEKEEDAAKEQDPEEETDIRPTCTECGSRNTFMAEGCKSPQCLDCGSSKC